MSELSPEVVGAVQRASFRRARTVRQDLAEGVDGLATLARIGPWFGVLGTALAIPDAFKGCGCEKSAALAAVAEGLSASMWPAALGLIAGLTSSWCHRYLTARLDGLTLEMENAGLELANQLARYRGRWRPESVTPDSNLFGAQTQQQLESERKFQHQSRVAAPALLAAAYCLQVFRYFYYEAMTLESCAWAACQNVAFEFLLSLLPAHVVWSRALQRRPGGLMLPAAAMCLCWSVAQFWL